MHVSLTEGLAQLADPQARRFAKVLEHGTLSVELYAPIGHDPQQPHSRDELYVVQQGEGWFVNGDIRHRFQSGDVLFVPAGRVHRFENFTEDFAVWVIFYGPEGGEPARPPFFVRHAKPNDWAEIEMIRTRVFIEAQACPPEEEWDAFDASATQFIARVNGEPAATARWRTISTYDGNPIAKLERFAILPEFRGRGYGHELVDFVMTDAEAQGFNVQMMHAQIHLGNPPFVGMWIYR